MGMGMGVGVGEIEEGLHKLGFAVNLCMSDHNSGEILRKAEEIFQQFESQCGSLSPLKNTDMLRTFIYLLCTHNLR